MLVTENASLRALNTFRVEARARFLVTLETLDDIPAFLSDERFCDLPRLILGGGSNILFRDDFPGVVVHVDLKGVELLGEDSDFRYLAVAAGENWHDFVRWTVGQDWPGLENLSLIPGTVGAAPVQNIGAYGVELADVCQAVEAVDLATGESGVISAEDCRFAYRDSRFKQEPWRWLITSVLLRLPKAFTPRLDYPGVREALEACRSELARDKKGSRACASFALASPLLRGDELMPLLVSDAICAVRRAKLPGLEADQPGSAGSFFKNPLVSKAQGESLRERFPSMPSWDVADGRVKLSAGWLIDQCGWKGRREGDAGIYARHALVLVNHGRASGASLWALAQRVRDDVMARFGVDLEPEPIVLP